MAEEVVNQIINYSHFSEMPVGSASYQQGVRVRIVVMETRRSVYRSHVLGQEECVPPEERVTWIWGLPSSTDPHDPALINTMVSDLVSTIASLLPHNRLRVAAMVSNFVNTTLFNRCFFLGTGLEIFSLIHLQTTHHFDELDSFDLVKYGFLRRDDLIRLGLISEEEVGEEEDDDDDDDDDEHPIMPTNSYTASASDGGCCAVCLEDLIEGKSRSCPASTSSTPIASCHG